uniref:Uncharacterized protein n=1 Tax=Panagrolaimus superbus TaxID=310955 RepID=A0A914YSH2_9BILA
MGDAFKKTYELAEKQAMKKQEMFPEDNFILRDTVNAYLVDVMPNVKFSSMKFKSLHFAVEKGYYLTSAELSQFFLYHDRCYRREESFKNTYELAETQSLKKQEMFPDENFDLATSINAYLVDVIPHVKFSTMSCDFLTKFVCMFFYMILSRF